MSQTRAKHPGIKDRLIAEIRRQPKRAVVLGTLLLVLFAMTGREVLRRLGPSKAGAAVSPSRTSEAAGRTSGAAASGHGQGDANAVPPRAAAHLANAVVNRDLFTPNPTFFPQEQKAKAAPTVTPVDEEAAKREAERRAVQAQARALTLQSTVVGSAPTAIINGQILRVGDWINGFQVKEIDARACTVEKNGMRAVLEMAN